jgi:hypothetical protein
MMPVLRPRQVATPTTLPSTEPNQIQRAVAHEFTPGSKSNENILYENTQRQESPKLLTLPNL